MTKQTAITEGIHVHVRSKYEPGHSSPEDNYYLFSYSVEIENKGIQNVKLESRSWIIFDSAGDRLHIAGPGVVGKTPLLPPGASFTYTSACELRSPRGSMHGEYLMKNLDNGDTFGVEIPEFKLETEWTLN